MTDFQISKALWNTYPDAVVITDHLGIVLSANLKAEEIFGYEKGEMTGKATVLQTPETLNRSLDVVLKSGESENEGWRLRKDGTLFWVSEVISTLEDEHGKHLGFSIISRDLTSRINDEVLMNNQSEELVNKIRELENLAYIASHDLQEPLSTVSSLIELIRLDKKVDFDKEVGSYFQFIEEAVDSMRNLIRNLLNYSRVGSNKTLKQIRIADVIENVHEDFFNTIQSHGAKLEVGEMPEIMAYKVEMRSLFQNLIGNALKFRSVDKPLLIQIRVQELDDHWQFSVQDNGIGVQKQCLEKIFTIFHRLNSSGLYEGDGIGLAHCKKIVEIHEGAIWVESEIGKGSCFHFTISKFLKENPEEVFHQIVEQDPQIGTNKIAG